LSAAALSKGIVSWPPEGGGHSAGGVAVGLAGAATSDGFLPSWQLAGAAEQPGQQLRLQPKPIQTAQQYGGVGPKVVKAPPAAAAAVWAPRVESHPP